MDITEERHGDVVVLRCLGAPYGHTDQLTAAIADAAENPSPRLALDYSGLHKLTSKCVSISVEAFKRVYSADGRLAIVHPRRDVWSPFLAPEFRGDVLVTGTLDDALEFLTRPDNAP